jgi:CopG family transcriptional regulator/antitoxin EndoAI
MRNSKVISISLPEEMADEAEALAKKEKRSMSELVREALRRYQRTQELWEDLFVYGEANAKKLGLQEEDVVRMVKEWRKSKRSEVKPESQPKRTGTR